MANVFITGPKDAGKTSIVNACVQHWQGQVFGFRTYKQALANGHDSAVFLADITHPEKVYTVANIRNDTEKTFFPDVFDTAGVAILRGISPRPQGLVVMDEIGFIENDAPLFQREVKRVLGLGMPSLVVLRMADTPFITRLINRPGCTVLRATGANHGAMISQCLAVLGSV